MYSTSTTVSFFVVTEHKEVSVLLRDPHGEWAQAWCPAPSSPWSAEASAYGTDPWLTLVCIDALQETAIVLQRQGLKELTTSTNRIHNVRELILCITFILLLKLLDLSVFLSQKYMRLVLGQLLDLRCVFWVLKWIGEVRRWSVTLTITNNVYSIFWTILCLCKKCSLQIKRNLQFCLFGHKEVIL